MADDVFSPDSAAGGLPRLRPSMGPPPLLGLSPNFPVPNPFEIPEVQTAPSAARLAAEAFFSQRPAQQPDAAPVVTVVRGRVEQPSLPELAAAPADEAARPPRVFRLPSPASTEASLQTARPLTAAGAQAPASPETGAADVESAEAPKRRRSRRRLHGEVTITRPNDTVPVPRQGPDVLTERVPGTEPAHLAPARLEQVRSAVQEVAEGGDAWPRYPAMLQRLRALQAEAEAARQRERRGALVWIRQAIVDYDLSPSELGLR